MLMKWKNIYSYTVPALCKLQGHYSKDVTTDDFRGIAISSVISTVFEHCVLDRFRDFFYKLKKIRLSSKKAADAHML